MIELRPPTGYGIEPPSAEDQDDSSDQSVLVRACQDDDGPAMEQLFHDGRLPGHIEPTPQEFERLRQLISANRQQFWVAVKDQQIVGTIAVVEIMREVGQICWLRVDPSWQGAYGVEGRLIAAAASFAREIGLLKLVLQAPLHLEDRIAFYYQRAGFRLSRIHPRGGRRMAELYLDLYEQTRRRVD